MSSYIHHEMLLFLQAVVTGAALLLCYDFLRAFRRVIPHDTFWVAAEDILFWLFCSIAVFSSVYRTNQGSLRFFLFLGIALWADNQCFFCKNVYPNPGNSCGFIKTFDKVVAISGQTL